MRFVDGSVVLNRFLSIFSDLIFVSKVDPGIPSLAAAPDGGSPAQFRDRFRSLSNVNRSGSQNASKNAAAAAEKTE